MKSEHIYKAIGYVDDELLERCESLLSQADKNNMTDSKNTVKSNRKPKYFTWYKIGAAAACICIILSAGYFSKLNISHDDTGKVITEYTGENHMNGIYAAPDNGKVQLFDEVKAAMKENAGEKKTYFLALDIYKNGKLLKLKGSLEREEVKRLVKEGYRISYAAAWTYKGDLEKTDVPYLAGYFTEEQLRNFSVNEKYGYSLRFAENADGSPVSPDAIAKSISHRPNILLLDNPINGLTL